ncbi:MAG: putative deacylase [Myxococcota bacterium]
MKKSQVAVGWREWVKLPDFGVDWLKAKVDTGARSSSLHAFGMEAFERDGVNWIRFAIHPRQRTADGSITVEAEVVDSRSVKSSSGVSEVRPVIRTTLCIGGIRKEIEVTLTRRDDMGFRMLIGRQALRGSFSVEPGRSFLTGEPPTKEGREPFVIGGVSVKAGQRSQVDLPISKLASGPQIALSVLVLHGKLPGPTVWMNAAVHGDEINGIEIIRRVLEKLDVKTLRGTVIAVPVVNVHGFLISDRYLPDRRDLNRNFPGSASGSLARRIAHLLMTEVITHCSLGFDLHTGSDGRTNLPQIRADLTDPETERFARAFGCEIMLSSKSVEGTLRFSAAKAGVRTLLFEGGEARRFSRDAIETGTRGVLRVIALAGLIDPIVPPAATRFRGGGSRWVRARRSGLVLLNCSDGDLVEKGQLLGCINDPLGNRLSQLKSPCAGLIVGLTLEPLVNRGDALIHISTIQTEEPT